MMRSLLYSDGVKMQFSPVIFNRICKSIKKYKRRRFDFSRRLRLRVASLIFLGSTNYLRGFTYVTTHTAQLVKRGRFDVLFLYFIPSKMNTKAVYNYFSEVLECEPEKLEVLKVLMDVNGDEQGIIDFIDYYGFDVGELDEQIQERYE